MGAKKDGKKGVRDKRLIPKGRFQRGAMIAQNATIRASRTSTTAPRDQPNMAHRAQ